MSSPVAPFTGFGETTSTSVKFGILSDDGRVPLWGLSANIVSIPIPMSDRSITQYGGRSSWSVTFDVELDTVDALVAIQLLQGSRATLWYGSNVTNNPGGITAETMISGIEYIALTDTLLSSVSVRDKQPDNSCFATVTFQRAVDESAIYATSGT